VKRVIVVGGGIAGLTTALKLTDRAGDAGPGPVDVTVLEAGERAGGNIRTERVEGYTIECGPNGFLDNAPMTLDLVRRLGLDGEIQRADEAAARRFIYRDGRLHEAPTGPLSFLRSPLLSLPGRLRVFAEPFARSRPGGDETIFDFASRRIGPEAASVLVDAMVSGVFAGDVRRLSLASSFPKMAAMEAEHGGLVKAMVARMRERRSAKKQAEARRARGENVAELVRPGGPAGPGGTLTSFRGGLDTLIAGLTSALGGRVRFGSTVAAIERTDEASGPGHGDADPGGPGPEDGSRRRWTVRLTSGETLTADAVVVSIPSPRAAPLLDRVDPELAGAVGDIGTAGLSVVATAYDAASIPEVEGFGFLVPRGEGLRILGCLWDSAIFPGRAPAGKVLLRSMVGGSHDPAAVTDDTGVLVGRVRRDLADAMGIDAEPELVRIYRWPLGIGQYHVGHQARLDRIHHRLRANPGLWVAGSSYYGVSMNACIEKADGQADEIVHYLAG
jgi:oxygen-dependent protoporphyrinogen oxidase